MSWADRPEATTVRIAPACERRVTNLASQQAASALIASPLSQPLALRAPDAGEAAGFARAVRVIEAGIAARASEVSHPRHLPRLLHHGRRTDIVVVQVHGLYESPQYGAGLARVMHAEGANVLSVLLPGHWSKHPEDLDNASHEAWVAEVRGAIDRAAALGKRVVLAGFSTGGLLSVDAALEDPRVSALMLWSPALYVSQGSYWGAVLGKPLGLTLHHLRPAEVPAPDGFDRGYYSASAGVEVVDLIASLLGRHGGHGRTDAERRRAIAQRLELPTLMVVTDEDTTVPVGPSLDFFDGLRGPKRLVRYERGMGIKHGTIAKSSSDVFAGWEQHYNHQFDAMAREVGSFMRALAKPALPGHASSRP